MLVERGRRVVFRVDDDAVDRELTGSSPGTLRRIRKEACANSSTSRANGD